MTTSLADIQRRFQDRMAGGGAAIDTHLKNGGPFMGVYDHAYKARLVEVLAEDFEALHTLVGDAQFEKIVNAYLDAHPPGARSIRWTGRHLPGWLRQTDPWSDQPVIGDMAAFEWMLGLAFDAPDAAVIGVGDMAAVPAEAWPMLTFTFHPALNTVLLLNDVFDFQRAARAADEEPASAPEAFATPVTWAAWRDPESLTVTHRALGADEAAMLDAAQAGATFDALCEIVADHAAVDDAAVRAAGLLRSWIENGWVIGLDAEGLSF